MLGGCQITGIVRMTWSNKLTYAGEVKSYGPWGVYASVVLYPGDNIRRHNSRMLLDKTGMFAWTYTVVAFVSRCVCVSVCVGVRHRVSAHAFQHVGVTAREGLVCPCGHTGVYASARGVCWAQSSLCDRLIKRCMLGWASVLSPSVVTDLGSAHGTASLCLGSAVWGSNVQIYRTTVLAVVWWSSEWWSGVFLWFRGMICFLVLFVTFNLNVFLSPSQAPVNSYSTNSEDTDALIDNEPDEQNGAGEQTSETDR